VKDRVTDERETVKKTDPLTLVKCPRFITHNASKRKQKKHTFKQNRGKD